MNADYFHIGMVLLCNLVTHIACIVFTSLKYLVNLNLVLKQSMYPQGINVNYFYNEGEI